MIFAIRYILRYADPRPAVVLFAFHAATFGAAVTTGDVVEMFGSKRFVLFTSFGLIPESAVGLVFLAVAFVMVRSVALCQPKALQKAALVGLFAWVYTLVTIPVAMLWKFQFAPTGLARYLTPVVAAWWIYARASSAGVYLNQTNGQKGRVGSVIALVVVLPPVALSLLFQVLTLPDVIGPAAWTALGAVLTGMLKLLGDRYASKNDVDKVMGSEAIKHNQFLFGIHGQLLHEYQQELERTRIQLSSLLDLQEKRDYFCRNTCPTYPQRP